jgi:hypothetical protein
MLFKSRLIFRIIPTVKPCFIVENFTNGSETSLTTIFTVTTVMHTTTHLALCTGIEPSISPGDNFIPATIGHNEEPSPHASFTAPVAGTDLSTYVPLYTAKHSLMVNEASATHPSFTGYGSLETWGGTCPSSPTGLSPLEPNSYVSSSPPSSQPSTSVTGRNAPYLFQSGSSIVTSRNGLGFAVALGLVMFLVG